MKKLLVCNHKMFLTHDEALMLKNSMDDTDFSSMDLVVCPSYLNFDLFDNYNVGAQNCHYEDKGAYTGEVSAYDLNLRGIKYAIVGHAERRMYESNEDINKKVSSILRNMMTPILCVGETKIEKELMRTSEVLKKQLYTALDNITFGEDDEIIVAYEPVWAIGNEETLSKEEIEDTLDYIRKLLKQKDISNYKLLYGGSITASNIKSILSDKADGYLLGNASVNANELKEIIKCINSVNKDKI